MNRENSIVRKEIKINSAIIAVGQLNVILGANLALPVLVSGWHISMNPRRGSYDSLTADNIKCQQNAKDGVDDKENATPVYAEHNHRQ